MWNNNNRAHTTTWMTLRLLHQGIGVFPGAGATGMKSLFFWNSAASAKMRGVQARSLAAQMDNIFRSIYGASYEAGKDSATAVADMVSVLLDGNKTVLELADTNDSNYQFWKEGDNAV